MVSDMIIVERKLDQPFCADDEGARHLHGVLSGWRRLDVIALFPGTRNRRPHFGIQEGLEKAAALQAIRPVGIALWI